VLKLTQECQVLQGTFGATFAFFKMSSFLDGKEYNMGYFSRAKKVLVK
jgi:hypothetical protein